MLGSGGPVNPDVYASVQSTLKTIAERRPNREKRARTFELCREDARRALSLFA